MELERRCSVAVTFRYQPFGCSNNIGLDRNGWEARRHEAVGPQDWHSQELDSVRGSPGLAS